MNDKILYSSLQTKCYKLYRQEDTEEIELVSKVRRVATIKALVSDRCSKIDGMIFQRGDGGPVKVELTGPDEPGKN